MGPTLTSPCPLWSLISIPCPPRRLASSWLQTLLTAHSLHLHQDHFWVLWSRPSAAVTKVGWTFISHLRLGLVCLLCRPRALQTQAFRLCPVPGCDLHQHRLLRLCSSLPHHQDSRPPTVLRACDPGSMVSPGLTPLPLALLSFGIFNLLSWASDLVQVLSGLSHTPLPITKQLNSPPLTFHTSPVTPLSFVP